MKPCILWLSLMGSALLAQGEEPQRAVPVDEAPVILAPDFSNDGRVISRSMQFRVEGGDGSNRGSVALLVEEAKDDLLKTLEERDAWKIPVSIVLHGRQGDPVPARTLATSIQAGDTSYTIRIDLHLSRGIEQERLKRTITSALLYERALVSLPPRQTDVALTIEPWLIDGLREANAWRVKTTDRRLYETLFRHGGVFELNDLFAVDEARHDEMDAATRAAFRVSSGAMVMALLEQPEGRAAFLKFLGEAATYEGEMPALLRKYFSGLNLSETSLTKWWALQLASKGAAPATDVLSVPETDKQLTEALKLQFRNEGGGVEEKPISAWRELAGQDETKRLYAVRVMEEALIRLSYRCFPSYRPMILEYQSILASLAKNRTGKVERQFAALEETRAVMLGRAKHGSDFMDWFQITRARETSGEFDDYLRLKERLKTRPLRRSDPLSAYLDRMDDIFARGEETNSQAMSAPALPW